MEKLTFIAVAIAAVSICGTASAADGKINFTGAITDKACTVDTASANQTVHLGTIGTTAFGPVGATATSASFTINLTRCPATVVSASIRFDGQLASGNKNLLALSSDQTAKNVGVGIYDDNSTLIPVGKASTAVTLSPNGTNALNFIAKYVSTAAKVNAGSANATATFTVSYN